MDRAKVMLGLTGLQLWLKGLLILIPGYEDLQNALTVCTDALDLLKEQEAVVRCKDCRHWYFADNRIPSEQENVCGRNGTVVTPDWFCADGERRDDDA